MVEYLEQNEKGISERTLSEITKIHPNTMKTYMCNYRFNKFRRIVHGQRKSLFILNTDFMDNFYNYLLLKYNRVAAEKFKKAMGVDLEEKYDFDLY